eukprot:6207533-Pleurochrysis_carterae.AAC.3
MVADGSRMDGTGTMHSPEGSKACVEGQGMSCADLVAVHCYISVRVTSAVAGQTLSGSLRRRCRVSA